jgi:hypothetical protein
MQNWDSAGSILTTLWVGTAMVRTLAGAVGLPILQNVQTSSEAYSASYSMGTGVASWG